MYKKFLTLTIFIAHVIYSATYTPPVSPKSLTNLNSSWKFNKGDVSGSQNTDFVDASWENVTIPHTWNALDGQDGGSNYYRGSCWYRKHFTIPSALTAKQLYLQFDAVNRVADVYINGNHLGTHKGGYTRFRFPLNGSVNLTGDNVIAVKVNNAHDPDIPPLSGDFTFFGGIYRDVSLIAAEKLQIAVLDSFAGPGVYIAQSNVSATTADVSVKTNVFNYNKTAKPVTARAIIVDHTGSIIKETTSTQQINGSAAYSFNQKLTVENPHLWNGKPDPYLYTIFVEISDSSTITDLVQEPLGLRYFSLDAKNGFFLNGKYLDLHGVNMHQDFKNKGCAITTKETDTSLALVDEIGATFLRLPHYQHNQYTYNRCDSMGIIVWAELALVNYITQSEGFYNSAKSQLRELIRQNYNHPSIIFWSVFNEITLDNAGRPSPADLVNQLDELARKEDSTRLTTGGSCAGDGDAVNWHTQSIAFNKYFGWYYGDFSGFGPWADGIHQSHAGGKIGISEYGAGADINHHEDNPSHISTGGHWHPQEYQNRYHEENWKQMATRSFLWCKLVWNMFDFAADNRSEGAQPGINDKGLITHDRKIKKDAFYWYKANWSGTPFSYITSRRYTPRTDSSVSVKVYSNCPSVELFVNGASKGAKTSTDHIFTWNNITIPLRDNLIKTIGTKNSNHYTDSTVWGYFYSTEQSLSDGKTATASSSETGNSAGSATDGKVSTRWSAAGGTFPQWWMVDLGESKVIGSVRINWNKGDNHRQYKYKIEISDNNSGTFTTVADRRDNVVCGATEDLVTGKGRYVRITATDIFPSGAGWAGFYDVKVYPAAIVNSISSLRPDMSRQLHIINTAREMQITLPFKGYYTASLCDVRGRLIHINNGTAPGILRIKNSTGSGCYVLNVKTGSAVIRKKIVMK